MSDQPSRWMFALAIVGGVFWVIQSVLPDIAELISGVELVSGFLLILVFDYGSTLIVAVLAFSVFWSVFSEPHSFPQSSLLMIIAAITGILFLITTPFASGNFYYLVPQTESIAIRFILYGVWNASAAILVGSILVKRVKYNLTSTDASN